VTGVGRVGLLDVDDPEQVAEYEHGLYLAYVGLADNTLVRRLWHWDHDRQRVRTRIGYGAQRVYCARDADGRLLRAVAVNTEPERDFQGAWFGFKPTGPGCEFLSFMRAAGAAPLSRPGYRWFVGDVFGELVRAGFPVGYSTCTRRRLRPYLRLGATVLDRTTIDAEERFSLRWPIRELAIVPPTPS
jgi:hypothetical protein